MAVQGALKFGFAASVLAAPSTTQCIRLRNPLTLAKGFVWGESDLVPSGTTFVVNYETGELKKIYPLPQRPVLAALSPINIVINLLKGLVIHSSPILMEYLAELQEAESEDKEEPPFPVERFDRQYGTSIAITAAVATATQLTRFTLEKLASLHASARIAWKLTKDFPRSAVRKADFPLFERAWRVSSTACRANCLSALADYIVSVSVDTLRIYVAKDIPSLQCPQHRSNLPLTVRIHRLLEHPKTRMWAQRLMIHFFRGSISLAMGAVASGAMSCIAPNKHFTISLAGIVTEMFMATWVVVPVMSRWRDGEPLPRQLWTLELCSLGIIVLTVAEPWQRPVGGGLPASSLQPRLAL